MFVLCPHCHFLVGIDPRTGKPPAGCPKCGGAMAEPLPAMPAEDTSVEGTAAESNPAAAPTPLAPFVQAALPSIMPTLPDAAPASAVDTQSVQAPELEREAPKQREVHVAKKRAPEPASVAPAAPASEATPAPTVGARTESPAIAGPRQRWWSPRKVEPAAAATPRPATSIANTSAETTATSDAPTAIPAAQAKAVEADRAGAMIAALRGRRRTPKKSAEPSPLSIQPGPAVTAMDVGAGARPPAVQGEPVAATSAASGSVGTALDKAVETPVSTSPKRVRAAAASAAATTGAAAGSPVETAASSEPPVATATSVDVTSVDVTAIDVVPVATRSEQGSPIGIVPTDMPAPSHPLRRRTDFDPGATPEPVAGSVPPHPLRRRTDAPSFTRPRARKTAASRIGWRSLASIGGLSLLLAMQLLLAQRDTLAASPHWRPTLAAVCATLQCSLPPWHEPAAFTMLSRDVRPHPDAPGTLLINASFRNDARWPQPWPRLLLTLSDLDGRMVGARSFTAGEYLGATPTQFELAPGQTAAVMLSVVEPAPNIVAFTFDFR